MDGECVCEGEYWFGKCISCWEDETMVDGICTGKSLSEAVIFASSNPQYDDRLLIELQV